MTIAHRGLKVKVIDFGVERGRPIVKYRDNGV